MGYQVYEQPALGRWAGYGVPAECDWPGCVEKIDRGMAFMCEVHTVWDGDEPIALEGCGLFFCIAHRFETDAHESVIAKADSIEWQRWMLTDESWSEWRAEQPERVAAMAARVEA